MRNMGGMMSMLGQTAGVSGLPDNVKGQLDDKLTVRMEAIINSMTKGERRNPDIIKGSRKNVLPWAQALRSRMLTVC